MTDGPRFRSPALEQDFEQVEEIGRGGMGVVYLARERRSGRQVAVKVIRARYLEDAETIGRFEREATTSARLAHPNIVAVHELRRLEDGGIALIMQYVHGRTLKDVIRESGPLHYGTINHVLRDVAGALRHAHERDIVHRDVKPENIFIEEPSGRALLADFGIARSNDGESTLTLTGVAIGTPAYMSPEQIDGGELDGRSDIYSLGLVGWEMLTARRPWEGESLYGVIYRQKHEELPPPESLRPDVPPRIAHAISWAIQKEPRHRPATVEDFLRQLGSEKRLHAPPPSRKPLVAPPSPEADPSSTTKFQRPARHATPVGAHRAAPPASAPPVATGAVPRGATPASAPPAVAYPRPGEPPWWRRHAAVMAALVALPVLLVLGAVATGAISSGEEEAAPIAVLDEPVGVPMGPSAIADSPLAEPTAPQEQEEPGATFELPAERPMLQPMLPVEPQPREPPPEPPPAAVEPRRDPAPPPVRRETTGVAVQDRTPQTPAPIVAAPAPVPAPTPAPVGASGRADELTLVAAGGTHSCGVTGAGQLVCWGANDRGQLATDGPRRSVPATVSGDQRFAMISAGMGHGCALTAGGEAFCWGGNGNGQLGVGTTASTTRPARVSGGRTFRTISAGVNHTCGVSRSGEAYCWGANGDGQLGDGTTANRTVPVRIAGGGQFIDISAGRAHSCAVNTQQVVYCWGSNTGGQLGDGSTGSRPYPSPVSGAMRFVTVVSGAAHSCALSSVGEVYCWGDNAAGQLGDGGQSGRNTPIRLAGELRFGSLVAGSMHTCALTRAGEAYCWGRNTYGQLGDGSTANRTTPVRVRGGHHFRSIDASGAHTCGITVTNEALCWGYNVEGQLGDGTRSHRALPSPVGRPAG